MEKSKKSLIPQGFALLLLMTVCLNLLLDYHYYSTYQEKLEIISFMITKEDSSNLDQATSILKGKEILDQYGYTKVENTQYGKEFISECLITAIISIICMIFVIMYFYFFHKRQKQIFKEFLIELEQKLIQYREDTIVFEPISSDMEEVHKINHQLEALRNCLKLLKEQSFREREETKRLVTDISHQLKTPVAALDTCFTVLQNPALIEEERIEFASRCRNALDGLEMLLQSLVQISRLEVGMIELEMKIASIEETIVTALNRIYPKASEKDMELIYEQEEAQQVIQVVQDPNWLCEALINVLDNAVKYSPVKSKITIRVEKRISFVRIEISDQGIGIPKEDYHKIFQRFYRGTNEYIKNISGSGVGLYLAREIIEKHNGLLSVSSQYENKVKEYLGSTFLIQLPIDK